MTIKRNSLMAALESIDPSESVVDSDVGFDRAAIDTDTQEQQIISDEIEANKEAIDEALGDVQTLGEIRDTMVDTLESGEGMDPSAAMMSEVAVEAICARLGFKPTYHPLPATESFVPSNTRVVHTQIAIEGITDIISKVWSGITSTISNIVTKISTFFGKLIGSLVAYERVLQDLKTKVSALPDDAAGGTDISLKAVAKAFSIERKADYSTATRIVKNTENLIKNVLSNTSNLQHALREVSTLFAASQGSEEELNKVRAGVTKVLEAGIKDVETSHSKVSKSDVAGTVYGPFINSNVITVIKGVNVVDVEVDVLSDNTATSIVGLSKKEMLELLDTTLSMLSVAQDFKRKQSDIVKTIDMLNEIPKAFQSKGSWILTILSYVGGPIAAPVAMQVNTALKRQQNEATVNKALGPVIRKDVEYYMDIVMTFFYFSFNMGLSTSKATISYVEGSMRSK